MVNYNLWYMSYCCENVDSMKLFSVSITGPFQLGGWCHLNNPSDLPC